MGVGPFNSYGVILATTDSGGTWTSQTVPAVAGYLSSVACTSTADCYAVGDSTTGSEVILATTDSGSTWTSQTVPSGVSTLDAVACPSSADCYAMGQNSAATDGVILATTDSGSTWTSQTVPSGVGYLDGVACTSTSDCYSVGADTAETGGVIVATTDSGSTWTSQTLPTGAGSLDAVACPSSTDCYATGENSAGTAAGIIATTDSGGTWTSQTAPSGVEYLDGLFCTSTSDCYASGANTPGSTGAIVATTDSGSTWTSQTVPSGVEYLDSVACESATDCEAAGAVSGSANAPAIVSTTDEGSTWASQTVPVGVQSFYGVACPSASECETVGAGGTTGGNYLPAAFATTDEGSTWAGQTVPSGAGSLNSDACPSSTDCYAVGFGSIVATTDSGSTWTSQTDPSTQNLTAVACGSTSDCYAVGSHTIIATTTSGGTWTSQTVPTDVISLYGVACPSSSKCYAVGIGDAGSGVIVATTNSGGTWTSQTVPSGTGALYGVNCPTSTDCFAVGQGPSSGTVILGTTNSGGTWTSQTVPAGVDALYGVSCSSSADCHAVGASDADTGVILITTDSGTTWVSQTVPSSVGALYSVNCPSGTTCFAAGVGTGTVGGIVLSFGTGPFPAVSSVSPTSGTTAGGTPVTITGTNLTGATSVSFGATATTSFTVDSDSQITVTSPAGAAGTVAVTVTTSVGTSTTSSADEFTYVPPPSTNTAVNPYRICDTRGADGLSGTDAQCDAGPIAGGASLGMDVAATNPSGTTSGGVPASGVTAVVLNVTATGEASQGYLTVWPGGTRPTASSLNYRANKTVANLVTVALSPTGGVSVYSLQTTNLIVDVEGYYAAPSGTAGLFNSVTPYRICDTRGANGLSGTDAQCAGHTLSGATPLNVAVTGTNPNGTATGGVPASGVSAVVLNVTAIGHGTGYVTAYPQGVSAPTASNLNFSSGQAVPNRVIVPVSASGEISLVSNTSVDVVVDVNGWFTDGSSDAQTGAVFVPTSPSRICDTRNNGNTTPCVGETVTTRTPLSIPVGGQGPVPSGVAAVVANLTVTDTNAQSYLTAWPTGQTQPTASDLNWVAGLTVPNMAVVGLGTSGDISVYVAGGSADVIVDVDGYYVTADELAQSNLTNAMTAAKASYVADESYASTADAEVTSLSAADPSQIFVAGASINLNYISVGVYQQAYGTPDSPYDVIILAAYSAPTGHCWWASDVENPDYPTGYPIDLPEPGTRYAETMSTPATSADCNADAIASISNPPQLENSSYPTTPNQA